MAARSTARVGVPKVQLSGDGASGGRGSLVANSRSVTCRHRKSRMARAGRAPVLAVGMAAGRRTVRSACRCGRFRPLMCVVAAGAGMVGRAFMLPCSTSTAVELEAPRPDGSMNRDVAGMLFHVLCHGSSALGAGVLTHEHRHTRAPRRRVLGRRAARGACGYDRIRLFFKIYRNLQ